MGDVIDFKGKAPPKKGRKKASPKRSRVPATKKGEPSSPGRPSYDFDLADVESLGRLGCSYREMGVFFHVAESTIHERMAKDEDFRAAYERGFTEVSQTVRRAQLELALSPMAINAAGKATMLIWLGKSMLGQREAPTVNITNTNVQADKAAVVVQGGEASHDDIMEAVRRAQHSAIEEARRAGLLAAPQPEEEHAR